MCSGPYCENCGDCVTCFGEDSCPYSKDGKHVVIVSEASDLVQTYDSEKLPEPIFCDTCGVDCTPLLGIVIQVTVTSKDEKYLKQLQEAMKPYKINRKYQTCFPCYLKAFGIKPEGGVDIFPVETVEKVEIQQDLLKCSLGNSDENS